MTEPLQNGANVYRKTSTVQELNPFFKQLVNRGKCFLLTVDV